MMYVGGIDKYTVKVNDRDITRKVLSFDIYLDIFLLGWSVNINVADGDNLISTMPIAEFDKVSIYVKTDITKHGSSTDKRLEFKIIKITKQTFINAHLQEYRLVCVSPIIIEDMQQIKL